MWYQMYKADYCMKHFKLVLYHYNPTKLFGKIFYIMATISFADKPTNRPFSPLPQIALF